MSDANWKYHSQEKPKESGFYLCTIYAGMYQKELFGNNNGSGRVPCYALSVGYYSFNEDKFVFADKDLPQGDHYVVHWREVFFPMDLVEQKEKGEAILFE